MKITTDISLTLPEWLADYAFAAQGYHGDAERMALVVELSRQNVLHSSGGPFAAAVFEQGSGKLVAAGVNRVEPLCCSSAHAEVMAIAMAQKGLRTFDLGAPGLPGHELVTSAQPCIMCLGAVIWSGVRRVVCGANRDDVESLVGFDEGPVPRAWRAELRQRGIECATNVLRLQARSVLQLYHDRSGTVYNSRQG
jgi:tRNA(Arg) A34 adenosine deaminase TadA